MVDAVRSDMPTAVLTVDTAYEAVRITVTNPTPTGSRPAVTSNGIWRRQAGIFGPWTFAGATGNNGTFLDAFQRAGVTFDYFVRTDSLADSITYTITTPVVTGMWAYSSTDTSTLRHFPYTDGHSEAIDELETVFQVVGRQYPIVESGIQETQTIALNVTIPFSDADQRDQVEWWRARKRDKQTILYRDGRGRLLPCRILGPLTITAVRHGTGITGTLQRVDYAASTITIEGNYYQLGVYNDGGNGIYGNGSQGNGY